MKYALKLRKFARSLISLLALTCANALPAPAVDDEPVKSAGELEGEMPDGNVEISLKLLPSAPEAPSESGVPESPTTAIPQPSEELKPNQSEPSEIKIKLDTLTSENTNGNSHDNNSAVELPVGKAAESNPVSNRRISDRTFDTNQIAGRPVKKLARVLEIAIEPNTLAPSQECPGGQIESNEAAGELPLQAGDIPLEQDEHPFDIPAARSTVQEPRLIPASKSKKSRLPTVVESEDLKHQIETVLKYYQEHPENVARRGPWAIMHVILPYGVDAEILAGNRSVNAIGWLCHNGVSARQRMFQPTQTGFRPNLGPGVQGHEGQFLAILAQSRVHPDYPLQVGKKKYTIKDLIRYEMATCREKSELTFKLIGFSHYLEPRQTWKDNRGRSWSIEKLVAEELAQPINGAACGGTHRLMGLTCAVVQRQEAGLPITGHFRRAQIFLDDFVEYTLTLQNPDGSFSTEWFERRANESNLNRKIQTTGHILEWLVYTLPDAHLHKPEIGKAVQFIADSIGGNLENDWPIGPRGHSLRALALYHQRVFSRTFVEESAVERVAEQTGTDIPLR